MPGPDQPIELQNPCLQHPQLGAESCNADTGDLGLALVVDVSNDAEQLLDTPATDWCDNAKLSKMRADRIDHSGLLADEEMRVRCSIRQPCCSDVLVSTNRMLGRPTASQIASASVASFFRRLT